MEPAPERRFRGVALTVLAAALAGILVAAAAFLVLRRARFDEAADRAVAEARLGLAFAAQNLPDEPTVDDVVGVLDDLSGTDVEPAALLQGELVPGPTILTADDAPADLRGLVAEGQLAYQRSDVRSTPYLVVGGRVPGRPVELYLFRSELALHDELRRTAALAAVAAALLVLVAAVAARAAARHAFRARVAALAEARDRERRFSADVAHELRTPLTALVNEAALLLDQLDRLPPDARRPAELLAEDVRRLRRLVEELLEIARLDAGEVPVRPERIELVALIRAVVRGRGWEEAVRVEGDETWLVSDRRRVERIVANLVDNAVGHGGPPVTVSVRGDRAAASVTVEDRGPGIARELLPRVFERFTKGDPARSGGGTGLGLAIARENAWLLGGSIVAESEPGRGARFTLRLTVAEPLRAGDRGVASPAEDGGGNPNEGGER